MTTDVRVLCIHALSKCTVPLNSQCEKSVAKLMLKYHESLLRKAGKTQRYILGLLITYIHTCKAIVFNRFE